MDNTLQCVDGAHVIVMVQYLNRAARVFGNNASEKDATAQTDVFKQESWTRVA